MATQAIDFDALAQKHGAIADYDELAKKHGGIAGGTSTAEPDLPGVTPRLIEAAKNNPKVAESIKPTQFEKDRPGKGISLEGAGSTAWDAVKHVPGALASQLDPTEGASGAALIKLGLMNESEGTASDKLNEIPAVQAVKEAHAGWQRGTGIADKVSDAAVSGIGSIFGMSGKSAAEHAARGEGGQILGEAAVPTAMALAPLAGEFVKPLIKPVIRAGGELRENIGGAIHDPATGDMTPNAHKMSNAAGAVVGGTAGAGIGSIFGPTGTYAGGGIGASAGGVAGPSLMEKIFPEPASRVAARDAFTRDKILTEAQEGATKENATRDKATRIEQARLDRVAQKAADDAQALREKPAEDLMQRQKEQDALDREAKRAAREAWANRPGIKPMTPPEVKPTVAPSEPVSVFPEPRDPLPGDKPGAMWSVGREEILPESAGRGAPGAGDVLRNIGKPIIYTPREGVGFAKPKFVKAFEDARPQETPSTIPGIAHEPTPAPEPEAVPTEIKGITAKEKPATVKREPSPAIETRATPEEILDAEGLISQEIGVMQAGDKPGRYFDEVGQTDQPLTAYGQANTKGARLGGIWRGVKSSREMLPWMREQPESWGPAQLEKALRNKDSAMYKKAMESALAFIRREKGIQEVGPEVAGEAEFPPREIPSIGSVKFKKPVKP